VNRGAPVVLFAVACGTPTGPPAGTADVRLALRGSRDTMQFEVPVVAQRCAAGRGLLLHGAREGLGVLVWLRGGSEAVPDTGTYPLLPRGDSASPRGAIAAVRFLVGEVAHGLTLDDGTAIVTRATAPFTVQARGMGVETVIAQQRTALLLLERVPLLPDTVSCQAQP